MAETVGVSEALVQTATLVVYRKSSCAAGSVAVAMSRVVPATRCATPARKVTAALNCVSMLTWPCIGAAAYLYHHRSEAAG